MENKKAHQQDLSMEIFVSNDPEFIARTETAQLSHDAAVLQEATRLLDKYFHPSRYGQTPSLEAQELVFQAKQVILSTVHRITR